ncbi:hypothetical protein OIU78_005994 [Salix suchowensis]|nr:hypothetical protein OIU78_005994 [Salix suchowensis]
MGTGSIRNKKDREKLGSGKVGVFSGKQCSY